MLTWMKRHTRLTLLVGVCMAMLPSCLWPYSLGGASAAPTVLLHDTFIVNRAAYDLRLPYSHVVLFPTGSPGRGDIVLAQLPLHIVAIKRVLGLPGETIEVRENRVIVDGNSLPVQPVALGFAVPAEHHMGTNVFLEDGHWVAYTPGASKYRNSAPSQLGPKEYFLMGDNRDNSLDSRAFGPVSREHIIGKVILVLPKGTRLATIRD